jgi:hypothetical protein
MSLAETLSDSTRLVKSWGHSVLPDGRTVSEALTLEGIPLWEMFAVDLARVYLPPALSAPAVPNTMTRTVRPYFSRAKHWLRDWTGHRRTEQACAGWPSKPTVLCLAFSHYLYRDVLDPVAQRLTKHSAMHAVVLSDRGPTDSRATGPTFQSIWQHWDRDTQHRARALRRSLRAVEAAMLAPAGLQEILRDGDRRVWPQIANMFHWFFRVYVPILIPHAAVAQHILQRHRPAVVVSSDVADPRTRVFTLLCRRMGIPSMEMQNGPVGSEGIEMEWEFLTADYVSVWGERFKSILRGYGVPADRIIVTGSPRHDRLVDVPLAEVRTKRAEVGIPAGAVMAVLASAYWLAAYGDHSNAELLRSLKRAVFEAADGTPGLWLVVKPHPLEDVSETRSLAGNNRNIIFVDQRTDIRELTRVCDAFVSFGSTAMTDALVAHKPTICLVFPGWTWADVYRNTGAFFVAEAPARVREAFLWLVSGHADRLLAPYEPARAQFLQQWALGADGQAASRVASFVKQMAALPVG